MTARVLLTGFVPFGTHGENPSERLVHAVSAAPPPGLVLSTRILPVSYRDAFRPIREVLDDEQLDAVLMLGLGVGRRELSFERLAVNWRGGALADNDGRQLTGERVDDAGPAAYFATAPVDDMVDAVHATLVPAGPSNHAGTFLCNQILYQALRHCDRHQLGRSVGFLHVPLLPHQAAWGEPSLAEGEMLRGLRAALAVLAAASSGEASPPGSAAP